MCVYNIYVSIYRCVPVVLYLVMIRCVNMYVLYLLHQRCVFVM